MMTNEERIQALHARISALRRARERRKTDTIGASGIALTVCLLFLIFGSGGLHPGGVAGLYSGATMLFEGAGPYVLIAIIAFMAGVIVTAALIRNRQKEERRNGENRESTETKEDGYHREPDLIQGRKS